VAEGSPVRIPLSAPTAALRAPADEPSARERRWTGTPTLSRTDDGSAGAAHPDLPALSSALTSTAEPPVADAVPPVATRCAHAPRRSPRCTIPRLASRPPSRCSRPPGRPTRTPRRGRAGFGRCSPSCSTRTVPATRTRRSPRRRAGPTSPPRR
jgi:hypothetical protein